MSISWHHCFSLSVHFTGFIYHPYHGSFIYIHRSLFHQYWLSYSLTIAPNVTHLHQGICSNHGKHLKEWNEWMEWNRRVVFFHNSIFRLLMFRFCETGLWLLLIIIHMQLFIDISHMFFTVSSVTSFYICYFLVKMTFG